MQFTNYFLFLFFTISCTQSPPAPVRTLDGITTRPSGSAQAVFAGGCFWCMEPPFDKLVGVISTTSGFAGGAEKNPSYQDVSSGKTGHVEAVQIIFDPSKISFRQLVDVYWRQVDPTDSGGQFVDRGKMYRPVLFYVDEQQKKDIEISQTEVEKLGKYGRPIVVEKMLLTTFYPAEEYHQDYYQKNPLKYKYYRYGSGRDKYLEKIWGPKKN